MNNLAVANALALNDYAERLARAALGDIPDGSYTFTDYLDDDGQGQVDIPIRVTVSVAGNDIRADFGGTAPQVRGNVNCPLAVAAAAVYYVFRCLMPAATPACSGAFRPVRLRAPAGNLLNAQYPAAVAAAVCERITASAARAIVPTSFANEDCTSGALSVKSSSN